MSMAPPPPPSPGHRSTTSAPISGLPSTNGGFRVTPGPFGTPSRPAPSHSRPSMPHTNAAPYQTNNSITHNHSTRPPSPYTHAQTSLATHSQPPVSRDTRPKTPYGTPYGQHIHPPDPPMSAASSVSAASAAVDSPSGHSSRYAVQSTSSRLDHNNINFDHPRSTSDNARSGFSDPNSGSQLVDTAPRVGQSAPSTPARHRVSRSVGCYPVSPVVEARRQGLESPSQAKVVEPTLPSAPSVWTPSELAQYLSWALRTGGADAQGPTLPAPVVEDVVTWVLRSRVSGRQFVTGVDQGVTRPPPFLPVLAAMSRRLRRRGPSRLSDARTESDLSDGGGDQVTRVRRLAHAFDVISSSEASGDEGPSLSVLREQLTGDSVHGFGRATPKTEPRNWSRRDSVASVASAASGMSAGSNTRWRPTDASASSAAAWVSDLAEEYAATNESPTAPLRAKAEAKAALELAELAELAHPKGRAKGDSHSPPPPYVVSASPSPARPGLLFPPTAHASPATPDGLRSGSLTPLRPVHGPNSSSPEPDSSPSPSSHMVRMGAHRAGGVDPYAVLRRSSRGGRPSALLFPQDEAEEKEGNDDSDAENKPPTNQAHWSTTRRVTARPLRALNPVTLSPGPATPVKPASATGSGAGGTPTSLRRRREVAMAREVANLNDRIRELEDRLAAVETPASSSLQGSESKPKGEKDKNADASTPKPLARRRGWLGLLGLADADGTEPRLHEVPAVLFLLGVGVGVGFSAVVVRLLLHRKIAA